MKTTRTLIWLLTLALPALVLLALPLSTARAADPVILRVKTSGTTTWPCGDASDWSNACALQTALTRSVSGSEVWVAAGTYTPTAGADRFATFQLRNDIAVYGGFAEGETLRSQRNVAAHVTILSGDIGTQGEDSDNSYHVVVGSGVTNTAVLDGFTVTGGTAYGTQDRGGGMYNNAGSPTVVNVIFISNTASAYGGGMYNYNNSSPILTNVAFSGNSASDSGGGMYNYNNSSPTLTNATFSGNSATYSGGGMYNEMNSSPLLTHVTFSGNSAPNGGGIINYDETCTSTLTDVTFSDNSAQNGGGMSNNGRATLTNVTFSSNSAGEGGGGISNTGSVTLTNVTFASNTAGQWGGGMENVGSATLASVTFSGNSATAAGGGMDNNTSDVTLTNVTFSGNTSGDWAGGMYNYGSPTITNVTFSGNSAARGGGMHNDMSSSPTIRNAIFWGNAATNGSQIYNNGTPSLSDSVVQGGYAGGTNILTTDPHLGPLGNWGGATQTIPVLPGSSAIDAGNSTACASVPSDQRGKARVGTCDIGAFEFQGYALTSSHGDHQSTVINAPFANSLEVTVTEVGSGVLLPGAVVTFTAPSSGASAAWSGSLTQTATANASGAATVAPPTANGTAGSFAVTANVSGATAITTLTLTNAPADTTTVIIASANPVLAGKPLTLTVTVSPVAPASGTPTGSVDLYETSSPGLDVRGTRRALASQPLVNGVATFTVPSLTRGAHTLLGVYGGDGNYKASTSAIHIQNAFLLDFYLPLIQR